MLLQASIAHYTYRIIIESSFGCHKLFKITLGILFKVWSQCVDRLEYKLWSGLEYAQPHI